MAGKIRGHEGLRHVFDPESMQERPVEGKALRVRGEQELPPVAETAHGHLDQGHMIIVHVEIALAHLGA
jgi:hypothetical protein